MSFRSRAENDTRNFRQLGCLSTVIPAPAGIQDCFPAELARMTESKSALVLRLPARLFSSNFNLPRWVINGSQVGH